MALLAPKPAAPLCARCHAAGGGCCRLGGRDAGAMFGLTAGEVARLAEASGLAPDAFLVEDAITPEFAAYLARLHPVFARIMPAGRRRRLRLTSGGGCVFLGGGGCRLPVAARPLYCRLYPFWFTPRDRLMVLASPTCLAQAGARSWREVLARLGMEEAALRRDFAELLALAAAGEGGEGRLTAPSGGRGCGPGQNW